MLKQSDHTAAFALPGEDGRVTCGLCPKMCIIAEGRWGICKTRRNVGGALKVASYGRLLAGADDPVEKKPLFHYRPGSRTFSVASAGCNLKCPFCQNHHLSQVEDHWDFDTVRDISANDIVAAATRAGAASIAFTYSEPILMFELARDTAAIAGPKGLELLFVTNGQASKATAEAVGGFIRAANIDLKCFSENGYREILGGDLRATLHTVETWVKTGVWVEVTTLVVPGFNDSDGELRDIARYISGVDPSIPWHVSRFHPDYRWQDRTATPSERIVAAREIGLAEGLRFVYTGNVQGGAGEDTRCPRCTAPVIERRGFTVRRIAVKGGRCEHCGETIAGVGLP